MMVGEEYKASLFDGRSTYFEGERVEDLPGHPLLGIAVGHAASGYDWMAAHAIDGKSPLAGVPTTPEELRQKVDLVHQSG